MQTQSTAMRTLPTHTKQVSAPIDEASHREAMGIAKGEASVVCKATGHGKGSGGGGGGLGPTHICGFGPAHCLSI